MFLNDFMLSVSGANRDCFTLSNSLKQIVLALQQDAPVSPQSEGMRIIWLLLKIIVLMAISSSSSSSILCMRSVSLAMIPAFCLGLILYFSIAYKPMLINCWPVFRKSSSEVYAIVNNQPDPFSKNSTLQSAQPSKFFKSSSKFRPNSLWLSYRAVLITQSMQSPRFCRFELF